MSRVRLADLVPEIEHLYELYLQVEPDGDRETFASWLADEARALKEPEKDPP